MISSPPRISEFQVALDWQYFKNYISVYLKANTVDKSPTSTKDLSHPRGNSF